MARMLTSKATAKGRAYPKPTSFRQSKFRQAVRIMKLTTILLVTFCMQVSAKTFSQTVTLSVKEAPLQVVFKEIKRQTGYVFFYKEGWLEYSKKVTIDAQKWPLEKVLDACFQDQPVTYSITDKVDKVIALSPKPKSTVNYKEVGDTIPQLKTIRGKLFGKSSEPVVNATIEVKGSTKKTISNEAGEFELKGMIGNETLVVTNINYERIEIKVNGRIQINHVLDIRTVGLAEVNVSVSTGYQEVARERATGSFVQLDRKLIERTVSTDILGRLRGMVSGVLSSNFANEQQEIIQIRGNSSIFTNGTPLIVIDNFPYEGNINNLNPNDVESITVLKDAAAASIWGARAGNGVIVIKTKTGAHNQNPSVGLISNLTVGNRPDLYYRPQLSSKEYIEIEKILFNNGKYDFLIDFEMDKPISPVIDLLYKQKQGQISEGVLNQELDRLAAEDVRLDFEKYLFRKSINQQYALNISGGGKSSKYYVSFGYDRNLNQVQKNSYQRFSLLSNLTNSFFNDKLELSVGVAYSQSLNKENGLSPGIIRSGPYVLSPYASLIDESGEPSEIAQYRATLIDTIGGGKLLNWKYRPIDELNLSNNRNVGIDYRINIGLTYRLLKSLSFDIKYQYGNGRVDTRNLFSQLTYFTRDYINRFYQPFSDNKFPVPMGDILDLSSSSYVSHNARAQINFARQVGDHHRVDAIGGADIKDITANSLSHRLFGYSDDYATSVPVDLLTSYQTLITGQFERISNREVIREQFDRNVSVFSNIAYTYKDRYTFSGSARRDASNIFGVKTNQKWVPLWSVGALWNITNEDFFYNALFSQLKLRTTYGLQGNVAKNVTAYLTTRNEGFNNYGISQQNILNPPNANLRWEKVAQLNFGIDFAIMNNRISGSLDYFRKKGVDLMGDSPLPPSSGISMFRGNSADFSSNGVDLVINTINYKNVLKWSTTILFSFVKDKVTDYKLKQSSIGTYISGAAGISPIEGKPINSLFSYRWAGLDPNTGDPQIVLDNMVSKDYAQIFSSTNLENMVYQGSTNPTVFGAVRNTFDYKGFNLSFNIIFKAGYVFRRSSINYYNIIEGREVGHSDYSNRWQKTGDEQSTNVPSFLYPSDNNRDLVYLNSDIMVEKGDHIRLQDIRFEYSILSLLGGGIKNISLFCIANNVGLLWRSNSLNLDPDASTSLYPIPRSYSGGVRVQF